MLGDSYADNDPVAKTDPHGLIAASYKDIVACGAFCGVMLECKKAAEKATIDEFGSHKDGTPSNAFKHCYYSCCLASTLPFGIGKNIADGHEAKGWELEVPKRYGSL